jgi:hypothetical protein
MGGVGVRLVGDFAQYYSLFVQVYSKNYGWSAWMKNGQIAGDGLNAITAVRVRVVPNFNTQQAIATIGSISWINGQSAAAKPQIAYLEDVEPGKESDWKYTSCGDYRAVNQVVRMNLANCHVPDKSIVRLGVRTSGSPIANSDSTMFTEPFYFDKSAKLEAAYATFGSLFQNFARNIRVFGYGLFDQIQPKPTIDVMKRQVTNNVVQTALAYASLPFMVAGIAASIAFPPSVGFVAGAMAVI